MEVQGSSPIIYQSTPTFSSNALKVPLKERVKKNLPKFIFGILALVLVAELIFAFQNYKKPFPNRVDATSTIGVGKLILQSAKSNPALGESIPVQIKVVTAGRSTDSTDVILKYDPTMLDATSSAIVEGKIYKDYAVKSVDLKKGEVQISAITPPDTEGFVGVGNFATVTFIAKKQGPTKIEIDYEKGSTTDSNIVETGIAIDILDETRDLDLSIGDDQSIAKPQIESCGGYYQYCHNLVGQTGRQFCKQGRKVENFCTFDPDLTTECDICRLGF